MAYYLVTAKPIKSKLPELKKHLENDEYLDLQPFGEEVTKALTNARWLNEESTVWEEEDYCTPPLDAERKAVFDDYFKDIEVEVVERNKGWEKIKNLDYLFDDIKRWKI